MKLNSEKAGHLGLLTAFAIFVAWFVNDAWQASPTLTNMLLIGPVAALSCLILVGLLISVLRADTAAKEHSEEAGRSLRERYGVAFGCLLLGLYVLALEYIGFDLASMLFCATTMIMMGQRSWMAIAVYSLIMGIGPVYVLVHMMGVPVETLFVG